MTTQRSTARVQLLADGTGSLTIGGATEHVRAADVATARSDITELLRRHAHNLGHVIHVEMSDPLGQWALTITPHGAITTAIGGTAQAIRIPDLADTLFGHPAPAALRETQGEAPRTLPRRRLPARRPLPLPAIGRKTGAVAGALTLALAAGAAVTWTLQRDDAMAVQLQPVQGWTQHAAWASDPLATGQDTPADVLPVNGAIATTLTDEGAERVAALDPSTGEALWADELDEPLTGRLQAVGPKRDALAATTAHSLSIWKNPSDPEAQPARWTFSEADVMPVPGGEVPVLFNADTATALTVHDGKLLRRALPGGTRAVAALPNGDVLAVSKDGHWWSVGSDRGEGSLLQPPTYGARVKSIVGVAGTTLLVTWTSGTEGTTVAGYAIDDSMSPTWHVKNVPGDTTHLTASPDGTWAIVGAAALDVATGAPTYLPKGWKTVRMTNEAAWSREHVAPKLDPARVLDKPVEDLDAIPVATTRDGRGLVVHDADDATRIIALDPNTERSYKDGDQVITKPPATPKPAKETPKAAKKKPKNTKTKRTTQTTRRATPAKEKKK